MSKNGGDKVKETPEERELAKIAGEKWGIWEEKVKPVQNWYMEEVRVTPDEYERAGRETSSSFAAQEGQAYGLATDAMPVGRFGGGLDASLTDIAVGGAEATAGGQVRTGNDMQSLHYQGLENIIAMGEGQAIDAQHGLSDVAGLRASEAVSDARIGQSNRFANQGLVGAGIGAGLAVYNNMPSSPQGNSYSQVNSTDPGVRAYQQSGGYRGSGF